MITNGQETLILSCSSYVAIHRNASFETYFSNYSRELDGIVRIATYSFDDRAFSSMHKLMPFSVFYISPNHRHKAIKFLRRFPLYIVYMVDELHTKCVYFEKSRKALIGSQNLFSPTSKFEELSCELVVSEDKADKFTSLAFNFAQVTYLQVKYEAEDIMVYQDNINGLKGRPYLPCHLELEYWTAIGQSDTTDRSPIYHHVYVVLEYDIEGDPSYLAFDRHYQFCGELSSQAFSYLCSNFSNRIQDFAFLAPGHRLSSSAPFKDLFAVYHPIARIKRAKCAHYFE